MMMIEAVLFAVMVLVAISFISELSPPAVVSHRYSNNLKIWGDNALRSMDKGINASFVIPQNYPNNTLCFYLITNSYIDFIDTFGKDSRLSNSSVMYNVYISNGTKTIFWCSSIGSNTTPLLPVGTVCMSHKIVSIDPSFFNQSTPTQLFSANNPIDQAFVQQGYNKSSYDVIIELWYYA